LLADLHGQLAGQSGLVDQIRHGRRAAALYARALQLDPSNPLAHVGLAIAKLETPAMFGGSVTAALRGFRHAQSLDPRCDEAWTWEGIALRREGDILGAQRAFVRALTIDPGSAHARHELEALKEDFE
jgi:Tfp pilus assembly protein PilF